MKISRYLQIALLASLMIAASTFGAIQSVHAISNTPTFVLGVSNLQDPLILDLQNLTSSLTLLPSVSSLSLVGTSSILYVDGNWLASTSSINPTILSSVVAEVLAGVPTVTVRGDTTLLSRSISGLFQWHVPGLNLISQGLRVTGSTPDGTRISSMLQVLSGFDYAVQTEFDWANNLLSQGPTGAIAPANLHSLAKTATTSANTSSPQPHWELTAFVRFDTGNGYSPEGRIISTFTVYDLDNSGSTKYGWYNLFFNQTIMPGIMIYNSPWRTSDQVSLVHVGNTTSTALVDHGPASTSSSGPFVVSYSTGVTTGILGANVTASQSQSYPLKHANVTDTSQPPDVGWDHTVDARTSAGTLTFQVIPGVTVRWLLSSSPNISLGVATTFAELSGNSLSGATTITYGMFPG
jgi:hypothetical protein